MRKLFLITVILIFVLLVFGSAVAAYGACLGCPDWPLCYGKLLPPEQLGAQLEYTHRLIAALSSLSIFATTFVSVRNFKGKLKFAGWLITLLIIVQILIGGLTVILKMPFWVSMSHAFFGVLTYATALYIFKVSESPKTLSLNIFSYPFLMFLIVFLQAMLGTAVRKFFAGLACGQDIFLCMGVEWNGGVLLQVIHRLTGFAILIISLYGIFTKYRKFALTMTVLSSLGIIFGMLSVYSLLSPTMVSLHYSIALLILTLSFVKSIK